MTGPRYATVTVTYHPDVAVFRRQLAQLGPMALTVVVDNGSDAAILEEIRDAVGTGSARTCISLGRNLGLAAGFNVGARAVLSQMPDCDYLVFLDQDTEPGGGNLERLLEVVEQLRTEDPRTGLVGPMIVDAATGLSHGIHVIRGLRWARVRPGAGAKPVPCASVNGSGMVVPASVFNALGGFDESLFIDHVDSDYSFRASHAGLSLYAVPAVRFAHRMGQRTLRLWFAGWRIWPYRSPARHYYLFRNAVLLMRRAHVPRVWKVWAAVKLLATALAHGLADRERAVQLRAMVTGVRAGLLGETGPRALHNRL